MRDKIKEQLDLILQKVNWFDYIEDFQRGNRVDVIWVLTDFVKEGKFVEQAMKMAELFVSDPNPSIDNEANQSLLKGDDFRAIVTVRGTLPWLLQAIIGRLDTDYYPRVITLIEKLAKDQVVYVRQQVTVALGALTINFYAYKNKDETPFNFKVEDRSKVKNVAFYMLKENRKYPRVLEYLVQAFGGLRLLSEDEAFLMLNTFLYEEGTKFNPYYVLDNVAPLLIYYAEYRKDANDGFNEQRFADLLNQVLLTAEPVMKSTIVWHIWKTIDENPVNYARLKKYINQLFQGDFSEESLGQYDILIEKVLKNSPKDGVELFKRELNFINRSLNKIPAEPGGRIWFHYAEEAVEKVAELDPNSLPLLVGILKEIYLKNGYVGDIQRILAAYKKAPVELQKKLEDEIKYIADEIKTRGRKLF